jgi:glycosyltransferase involved in cell wall biosynthesis
MRFIYNHRTQGRGAEGHHIVSLINALTANGHEVTIVSPPGVDPLKTAGTVPVDKGYARAQGIQRLWRWISRRCPQFLFEACELLYNVYLFFRLIPFLGRQRADVYYERYAFFLFLGVLLAKRRGLPVLLEVNEVVGIQRARGQVLVPLALWIERVVFRRADAILVVSSFLEREVIKRGARENVVHVIPNGIEPKWICSVDMGKVVRREYKLDGATVLGFAGWFDRWDRLDLLVEIMSKLEKTHGALRLLLVGDGPVMVQIKKQIRHYKMDSKVILTGAVARDAVLQFIDAMDICVLPDSSLFGSPIALFEFMARGKAIVAPDLQPIRDVVIDQESALIVKRGDIDALGQAILRLIDNVSLRRKLGCQARTHVMERHTWEANGKRVSDIAKNLLTI